MHKMDDLMDMLCDKLDEYAAEGKLTATSLDAIHKMTDTIKNIKKIEMLDEAISYGENDYSRRYSNRGASYAQRRDSRGRYSRNDGYHDNYSRDEAKDHMINQIDDMMHMASSERERKALREAREALQNV